MWKKSEVRLIILGIAILASFPLLVDYMITGEDSAFYWMRIETLAQSIGKGNIPVGGEVLLMFPALMRLIGFDMVMSYNTYIFAVNLGTAVIAYLCIKGCFRDSRVGMVGSLLYTLAPYRIYHIYDRSAVGEYTAMVFLPLLVYGFYQLFTGDAEQKGYRRGWFTLAFGFGGLALSHMLLYEIAAGSGARFQGRSFLDTVSAGIGMAMLLGVGAFWLIRDICRDKWNRKQDRATIAFFSIGVIALITGVSCFPWEAIGAWNRITAVLISVLQIPTILTLVPVACMTFVSCAGAAVMLKCEDRYWKNAFFVILCGTAVICSLYQTNDILMKKSGPVWQYTVESQNFSSNE